MSQIHHLPIDDPTLIAKSIRNRLAAYVLIPFSSNSSVRNHRLLIHMCTELAFKSVVAETGVCGLVAVSFPRPSRTSPTAHCQLAFDFAERLAATLSPLLSDSGTPRLPIESLHTALREWGIPTRSNSPTHSHPRHLSPPTRILTLAIDTSTYTRPLAFRLPNSILHTSLAHPHTHTPTHPHSHIPTNPHNHTFHVSHQSSLTSHLLNWVDPSHTSLVSHLSPLSTGSTASHLTALGLPPARRSASPLPVPTATWPLLRSPLSSLLSPHSPLLSPLPLSSLRNVQSTPRSHPLGRGLRVATHLGCGGPRPLDERGLVPVCERSWKKCQFL